MRYLSIAIGAAAVLSLSSCSPPMYHLTALVQNGALVFDAENPGVWPFKWNDDTVDAEYLEVVTRDEVLWAISAEGRHGCTKATENPYYREPEFIRFPVRYGAPLKCFSVLQPARPIPSDEDVLIRSAGPLQEGSGYFRVEGRKVRALEDDAKPFENAPSLHPNWQQPPVTSEAGAASR